MTSEEFWQMLAACSDSEFETMVAAMLFTRKYDEDPSVFRERVVESLKYRGQVGA